MEEILVVVAYDRQAFKGLCFQFKLNPYRTKYVCSRERDFENELLGYYRENIYPHEYGLSRPSKNSE